MKSNFDLKVELLGYIDMDCPRCNRHRVEKYENGELHCEKCEWNITLQKYESWEWEDEEDNQWLI